jgi:hypothetical protein
MNADQQHANGFLDEAWNDATFKKDGGTILPTPTFAETLDADKLLSPKIKSHTWVHWWTTSNVSIPQIRQKLQQRVRKSRRFALKIRPHHTSL